MKIRWVYLLPGVFLLAAALSRWPGLMPANFSAVYAFIFCAAVFLPGRPGWLLPFGFLVVTDLALNAWYQWDKGISTFTGESLIYLAGNYLAYGAMFWLGRQFRPSSGLPRLIGGGLLAAVAFYIITNSFSWLVNPFHSPEYTKNLAGWIRALTLGAGDWPSTWEFFRNSLLSSALFTALFGWAGRQATAESPLEKGEALGEPEPDEAGA